MSVSPENTVRIHHLGLRKYEQTWQAMQEFTNGRTDDSQDEFWITEHPPVFTLGVNGKKEHVLHQGDIPLIHCDRGGQVTYHGPGQLVLYTLLDLKRYKLNVRDLVTLLEQAMISTLAQYGIVSQSRPDAPGVYVKNQKIGSIGLRIRRGYSYHGLSLNNAMNLEPFKQINPCGFQNLAITQLADFGVTIQTYELALALLFRIFQGLK